MLTTATLLILGIAAGIGAIISAVTGMAGGMLLLATMLALGIPFAVTIGLHALVQLVANVTRLITLRRHIRWRDALWILVPATPGPLLGLELLQLIDESVVRIGIGLLVLYVTWKPKKTNGSTPARDQPLTPEEDREATRTLRPGFVVAGVLGGVFGVLIGAVGLLIGPAFVRSHWPREQVVATQTLCQAWLHIIKLVALSTIGIELATIATPFAIMAGAAIVGTIIGRQLLHRVSDRVFRLLLRSVLTLLAAQLLIETTITLVQQG